MLTELVETGTLVTGLCQGGFSCFIWGKVLKGSQHQIKWERDLLGEFKLCGRGIWWISFLLCFNCLVLQLPRQYHTSIFQVSENVGRGKETSWIHDVRRSGLKEEQVAIPLHQISINGPLLWWGNWKLTLWDSQTMQGEVQLCGKCLCYTPPSIIRQPYDEWFWVM